MITISDGTIPGPASPIVFASGMCCGVEGVLWASAGALCMVSSGVSKSWSQTITAQAATAVAQTTPTIPIIVKDKTSLYWQVVLAGARKAGQELGVNVIELGADSESDING